MSQKSKAADSPSKEVFLFHPFIPPTAAQKITEVLSTRWIGQGPLVDRFEKEFSEFIGGTNCVTVGSGTDALHLAYLLAGIQEGDEVICPVFTCTATNLPLLYIGATPVFADIDPQTMNISVDSIRTLITERTRAIVTVDYGGLPCDYEPIMRIAEEFGLIVIDDAAHALGAKYRNQNIGSIADFTTYSFQAIKHITTGDGGMLAIKNPSLLEKAKRLRWFGIDRVAKIGGIWANDIHEVGYKYQMTDISAAMGLAGLEKIDEILLHRRLILEIYFNELNNIPGLFNVGKNKNVEHEHAAWLHTVSVENRLGLQKKLKDHNIESGQVHYRNDMYSVFGGRKDYLVNMDLMEDKYLVLPIHMNMTTEDAFRICKTVASGW